MAKEISEKIEKLIKPLIEEAGYNFLNIKLSRQDLIIIIDKEGGVSVEDCAKVSRLVDLAIEEANLIVGNHRLIVSSPGIK